jgi:hypothetical protein
MPSLRFLIDTSSGNGNDRLHFARQYSNIIPSNAIEHIVQPSLDSRDTHIQEAFLQLVLNIPTGHAPRVTRCTPHLSTVSTSLLLDCNSGHGSA